MFPRFSPTKVVSSLLHRFKSPAGLPASADVGSAEALELDPRIAFEVDSGDGRVFQALYPTRTRPARVEPEAMVYVQVFRDFDKAMRYVELHGRLRAQFGSRYNLWTVPINGRRDDDMISEAVESARDLLHALRNPVEVPVIDDFDPPAAPMPQVLPPEPANHPAPSTSQSRVPIAELVREGRFLFAGPMNWRGPQGQVGRPSFAAVLQRLPDGKEEKLFGSDLSRAISESGVKPGDVIRLVKYPRTPVDVGGRIVQKNIWVCEKLKEAGDADPAPGH